MHLTLQATAVCGDALGNKKQTAGEYSFPLSAHTTGVLAQEMT
ncbi:MAG: hypothetical protein Q4G30_04275 [Actinomycetaceae bacterium]|nr:hypothetical protein [Actinomycetaceae bacterium]